MSQPLQVAASELRPGDLIVIPAPSSGAAKLVIREVWTTARLIHTFKMNGYIEREDGVDISLVPDGGGGVDMLVAVNPGQLFTLATRGA